MIDKLFSHYFLDNKIMSDEIDDLSFPNAVITRLMNEAV